MKQVKQMVEGGVSVPTAIKEALGMSVVEFADKHKLVRPRVSETINLSRYPEEDFLTAISTELGGTPEQWAGFLWTAARPATVARTS